jgi:cell division protease FtsH
VLAFHSATAAWTGRRPPGLVAAQTSGLTGADLANICNEAAIFCAGAGTQARAADFDGALERVVAGVLSSTTLNPREREIVAYHEAGPRALPRAPRHHRARAQDLDRPARSALGYVMNLPDEDSYLKTREELMDQITVLLGGGWPSRLVFGR